MIKIFDKFTAKVRNFIVEEKYMVEALRMIQSALPAGYNMGDMNVGNCGWAEQPDSWFIHINLTDNQWRELLKACKDKGYHLIIKEQNGDMYFTKIKES